MEYTINDLYLKYIDKVGETLESDRYFQYLFEMVQAGNTTLQQTHQVLHKVVDERWLTTIEDSLDAINTIIEKPRRFITTVEEVVPVALARKISADSVRHLSMNTQFIASDEDGEIHPTRVLNVSADESYDLYENRFIYHLIQRLVTFIDKRTDVIFWSTGDETRNTLTMESKVDDAYEQIEYKIEMKIKNLQSFAENDSDNMQVFMRIDRVRRMVMALRNSSFCSLMAGCAKVRSPIQRTNLMMKDPNYRTCYKLWQFLESYDEVGYTIDARDSALEFDEEYLIQLYTNLITNYTVFKSLLENDPRQLEEAEAHKHSVVKPKFIKEIEEQIVDDYNIPDVEVRKVIIEEVTQAQLDAEAKLEEETALRKAAEEARMDAEVQLENERWQMQSQMFETQQLAEEQIFAAQQSAEMQVKEAQDNAQAQIKVAHENAEAQVAEAHRQADKAIKEAKAEAEKQSRKARESAEAQVAEIRESAETQVREAHESAEAQVAKARTSAEMQVREARESADAQVAEMRRQADSEIEAAKTEAERQSRETRENAESQVAEARESAKAQVAEARENAETQVREARESAEAQVAEARATAQSQVREAQENAQAQIEEIRRQAEAQMEAMRRQVEEELAKARQQAEAEIRQAKEEAKAKVQEAEAAAEEASQARRDAEEAAASEKISREQAEKREKAAVKQAEKEAKARAKAEAKADENRLTNRIIAALLERRENKNPTKEESEEKPTDEN